MNDMKLFEKIVMNLINGFFSIAIITMIVFPICVMVWGELTQ